MRSRRAACTRRYVEFALFLTVLYKPGRAGRYDLDEYQKQQERDALRAEIEESGERPDPATVREWHESSQAELRESLAAVLSTEQLEKFEILAERLVCTIQP